MNIFQPPFGELQCRGGTVDQVTAGQNKKLLLTVDDMPELEFLPSYEACRSLFGDPLEADDVFWYHEDKIARNPRGFPITEFPDLRMYSAEFSSDSAFIFYRILEQKERLQFVRIYKMPLVLELAA